MYTLITQAQCHPNMTQCIALYGEYNDRFNAVCVNTLQAPKHFDIISCSQSECIM